MSNSLDPDQGPNCLQKLSVDNSSRQRMDILAQQISRYDISSWVRNSYLTMVILPRLSREGCTLVALELTHMADK